MFYELKQRFHFLVRKGSSLSLLIYFCLHINMCVYGLIHRYMSCNNDLTTIKNASLIQQFSPPCKKCLTGARPKLSQKTGIVIASLCRDVKSILFLTLERKKVQWWISRAGREKRKRSVWLDCTCVSPLVCKGRAK